MVARINRAVAPVLLVGVVVLVWLAPPSEPDRPKAARADVAKDDGFTEPTVLEGGRGVSERTVRREGLTLQDFAGIAIPAAAVMVRGEEVGFTDPWGVLDPSLLPFGSAGTAVLVEVRHPEFPALSEYRSLPLDGQVLRLRGLPGLAVTVLDSRGKPVVGAHCQIGTPDADELVNEGWTDHEGKTRLIGRGVMEVALLVVARGYQAHWEAFL